MPGRSRCPIVVVLFAWDFPDHAYWATAVFAVAMATDQVDGWLARRRNQTSAFGSLLDPIADKVLVLAALAMLVGEGVAPAWMVAAIVAREIAVSGLRLAALERGVVMGARDLGKLKTWAQTVAATIAGLQAAGAWDADVAWWALLVATAADLDLGARLRARRAARAARRERRVVAVAAAGAGAPGSRASPSSRPARHQAPFRRVAPRCELDARPGRRGAHGAAGAAVGIVAQLELHGGRLGERHEPRGRRLERGDHDGRPRRAPSRSRDAAVISATRLADADADPVADRDDRGDRAREVVHRRVRRRDVAPSDTSQG